MNKKQASFLVILIFVALSVLSASTIGEGKGEIAKEIWALEEAYISHFVAANHKAILSMYHERFLGWPDDEKKPSDFESVKRYLQERFPKPVNWIFKIERQGITHLKNIVINHYLLHISVKNKDGKEQKRVSRMTHTWIKTKKGWKILGGMSNAQ